MQSAAVEWERAQSQAAEQLLLEQERAAHVEASRRKAQTEKACRQRSPATAAAVAASQQQEEGGSSAPRLPRGRSAWLEGRKIERKQSLGAADQGQPAAPAGGKKVAVDATSLLDAGSGPPTTSSAATGKLCIGCNERFGGARCKLLHPTWMYEDPTHQTQSSQTPQQQPDSGSAHLEAQHRAAALKATGSAAFRAGDFERAAASFSAAATLEPDVAAHYSNHCLALLQLPGESSRSLALATARTCVAVEPTWAKGHYRLGCALLAAARPSEACEAFQEADRLEPGSKQVLLGLTQARAAVEQAPVVSLTKIAIEEASSNR